MYPPYFVMPIFGIRVGVHHNVGSFCVPAASLSGGKERQKHMKLKIRYENEYQTIELDAKATDEMWVSLSIDCDEDMTQEEKEQFIQDAWDEQYNKPEYNSWHKYDRHTGNAYMKSKDGTVEVNTEEAIMFRATDKSALISFIDEVDNQLQYEHYCDYLRSILKPDAAEMVIAIVLDGMTFGEYAASIGEDSNNVSHRYRRAINKLKKVFSKTSF